MGQAANHINLRCNQLREMLGIFRKEKVDEQTIDAEAEAELETLANASRGKLKREFTQLCLTRDLLRRKAHFTEQVELRSEIFVLLFFRLTDIWNEKVFRVRFEDSQEVLKLMKRLGMVTFFPFIQPEYFYFEYDFAMYDERIAASLLVQLNSKESPRGTAIADYTYTHVDGKADKLPHGIPQSWNAFNKMPHEGKFRGVYLCSPEERNFKVRRDNLLKYGYWEMDITQNEVRWWAGLQEAPEDVIIYVEWMIPRHASVDAAYHSLWSSHNAGSPRGFNIHSFERGLLGQGFKLFDGQNQHERIRTLFRYLDVSQEGEVSIGEWRVLKLLWQEIELSVEEFEKFVHRTFQGSLRLAWDFFDEDASGEITFQEFKEAVNKVGYFGPVKQTFSCIHHTPTEKKQQLELSSGNKAEHRRFAVDKTMHEAVITFDEFAASWGKVKDDDGT